MSECIKIKNLIVIVLILSLFLQLVPFFYNPQIEVSAEPNIIDNGDKTMTAIWDFNNTADYLLFNTLMNNGEVNLTLKKYWWNQTTQNDHNNGTFVGTITTPFGEVILADEMKSVNLIKTGDFSLDQDWVYTSGNKVVSKRNTTGENAEMGYSYHTGDNIAYLIPAEGEDDGYATYWFSFGIYTIDNSSSAVEIGFRDMGASGFVSRRSFFYFDLSSMPSSSIITNVSLYSKIQDDSSSPNHLIDIHALEVARANSSAISLYTDCGNGTLYIDDDDSLKLGVAKVYHEWNLGAQAVADLQNSLTRGWFGIGIHEEGDDTDRASISSVESSFDPQLNVSYTTTAPITFNETVYVNQTFYKPNITPNNSSAVNLSFDYIVEKLFNTSADLIVKIDDIVVWNKTISSTTPMNTVYKDIGQFMTEPRDYNISLQLHIEANSIAALDCAVKYDNVNITTLGYSWFGNYTSQVFDAGCEVLWDKISWNSFVPSETNFKIRTRNSINDTFWDDWSHEYSNSLGEQITPIKGQELQFTVNLSTANYTKTPVLSDINISFKKYCWDGTLEMKDDLWVDNIRNWGIFTWEDQINETNGQNISYWYSIDKGSTWNQVPFDGNMSSVSIFTNRIRFKANFTTNNPSVTPTLYKWNLTYQISELADLVGWVEPGYGFITSWFNFTLRYTDSENDPPVNISLNITEGTSHIGYWNMIPLDISDTNYTNGKWYFYNFTGFARGSNYTFHFAALDDVGIWSKSETYSGPIVINSPPRITTNNIQGAEEGILYYVDYEAEDLENDTLLWSLKRNATWLNLNPNTGNLSGTPPSGVRGIYWVNMTVYDGFGGIDWTNFTLVVGDTIPPVANAGEDDWVYEDQIYRFDGTNSYDNSGVLNYTWYFGDGTVGYGLQPEHVYTKKGIYLVALVASDPLNNEDTDLIYITVENKPPVAHAGNDIIANEGETVYFTGINSYDTYSDNDTLFFLWYFDEDDEYDKFGINSSFTWFDETSITVRLKVIDNDGDFNISEINVTILNVDPVVDVGNYYTGPEGSEIILIVSAYDPGQDNLEFRWDWENDGINDTGWSSKFFVRHAWGVEGNYTVRVEVRDGDGGFGEDTAKVNVTHRKKPPVISNLGSRQVRYEDPYPIDLSPYIKDEDTPLSELEIKTSDPVHVSVGGLTITLIYPQSMTGQTVSVEVFVSDGTFTDSEFLTVLITENYPPTLKKSINDVQFYEDEFLEKAFNLNDYFEDRDLDKLKYGTIYNEPNIFITIREDGYVDIRTSPNWAGNASIRFLGEDPSGAFAEDEIQVSVIPLNDHPIILKQILSTTIGENENWSIDLSLYFLDVDTPYLTYSCNYPQIQIDQLNHSARWVPNNKKELKGVIFTASDENYTVSLDPFDLKVVEPEPFNWLFVLLALIIGALTFAAYREIRYRYSIEEVFLVDNAGVLLVHMSRGESKAIDAKLVSGMLTAVQEFVRDSFMGNEEGVDLKLGEGALGKLEYGDFQIVIERGEHTFLSAVISGYDNRRLRKRMRDVVEEFESKYKNVLLDWDGDMGKFEGAERIVGRLVKGYSIAKEVTQKKMDEKEISEMNDIEYETEDELPYGDFGDVPSYYDDISNKDMGKFDATKEHKEKQQTNDKKNLESSENKNNKSSG